MGPYVWECTIACKRMWPALLIGILMGHGMHLRYGIWDRKYGMHNYLQTDVASPTDRATDGTRDAP